MKELTFNIGADSSVTFEVNPITPAEAQRDLEALIRQSFETGCGFLLPADPAQSERTALLINVSTLQNHLAKPIASRTLGDIIDALPFRKLGMSPLLELGHLPNDTLPDT